MSTLILTIIGEDRPGLVDELSGVIAEHGGNWEHSRMAHLANKFAGILLVNADNERVQPLQDALASMSGRGLSIRSELAEAVAIPGSDSHRRLTLELLGQDHPGIVHDIAHALSSHGISIEELDTATRSASMAGGTLFEARATLLAPRSLPLRDLQAVLEALANELMVDVELIEEA